MILSRQALYPVLAGLLLSSAAMLAGCQKQVVEPDPTPPPPTFTGPAFLRGTVGSLATLSGYEPMLVSGYGLVVNLDGTGSPQVPAYLEGWMLNQMRRGGLGSAQLDTRQISPRRVLASRNTAVVQVEGLIPAGATRGSSFDVLVTALDGTDTVSLAGGQLWTVDLSVGGASPDMRFRRPVARARGPLYMKQPAPQQTDAAETTYELHRQAVALSGGVVSTDRRLELVLNQPSWTRSAMIADRINERFRRGVRDTEDTAVAKDDVLIELNIPLAWRSRVPEFLNLLQHLYIQRPGGFEQTQARRLADVLVAEPRYANRVGPAWVALGKIALPVISRYYDHESDIVSLTALEAGVLLEDGATTQHLERFAKRDDPALRQRAAGLLVHLPRNLAAARTLISLLDDQDTSVRLAAYESLANINDPLLDRLAIGSRESFKFVLDLVPASRPLVYVTSSQRPRIVVFDPNASFAMPMVARMWENRLMLRANAPDELMSVFYQQPRVRDDEGLPVGAAPEPEVRQIAPAVANLVRLLAQPPMVDRPDFDGLDLSYSHVVNVLQQLDHHGYLQAELVIEESPLAQAIEQWRSDELQQRPELGGPDVEPPGVEQLDVPGDLPAAPAVDPERDSLPAADPEDFRPEVGAMPLP